jgi:DNA polymerase-3 subunit delta'
VTIVDTGDEASIKIKRVRERLLDVVGFRPFEGRRRVFIVDPADALTVEAQDALLKTLEEPPPSTTIVLVSAYPDTLLPTILSRCRRLRFGPLADLDAARVLQERLGVPEAKARLLAAGAGGSVSRALAEEAGDIAEDRDAALSLLQAASRGAIGARLKAAATLAQHESKRRDRAALADRLALVASLCRDVMALRAGAEALAHADEAETLRALVPSFAPDRLTAAFATVQQAQQALDRNASPKLVADWVGVRL